METVEALTTAVEAQWALGRLVAPADLARATRCPGWSVFDVVNHSIGVTLKFAEFASGSTDAPQSPTGDLIGTSLGDALGSLVATTRRAWESADMTRECHLPFGIFRAEMAAGINLVDVLAHGWDIGSFRGRAFRCDDAVWSIGLEVARKLIGQRRDPRHYGHEIGVAATAPAEMRFLGYLGRG
jgi:uncharacterized protein (TIGR03086 family)